MEKLTATVASVSDQSERRFTAGINMHFVNPSIQDASPTHTCVYRVSPVDHQCSDFMTYAGKS